MTEKDRVDLEPFAAMTARGAFLAVRGMVDMATAARRLAEERGVIPAEVSSSVARAELEFLRELKGLIDQRIAELEASSPEPVRVSIKKKGKK